MSQSPLPNPSPKLEVDDGGRGANFIAYTPAIFVLIWSTGFISAKFGMPYAPPFTFLALRCAAAVACFVLWAWACKIQYPQGRAQWGHLLVAGVLLHAGYLGGVWSAVKGGMGAGLSALIVGLQPILTAVWVSAIANQERVRPAQWLGLVLGFGGLVLVIAGKSTNTLSSFEVTGTTLLWSVFALLSITAGTLYQKRFVAPCDVRTGNAVQLLGAALACLPFALLEPETMNWQTPLVGAFIWSVLVLSLGGSTLFYLLIQRGAATKVTALIYLVPPTTALIAWVLFGESITLTTLLGTALCALGVWLVSRNVIPAKAGIHDFKK